LDKLSIESVTVTVEQTYVYTCIFILLVPVLIIIQQWCHFYSHGLLSTCYFCNIYVFITTTTSMTLLFIQKNQLNNLKVFGSKNTKEPNQERTVGKIRIYTSRRESLVLIINTWFKISKCWYKYNIINHDNAEALTWILAGTNSPTAESST
jgi:magnesium-transporting ATPase (P-type)